MSIEPGGRVPDTTLWIRTPDGTKALTTAEIFAGKRVVLFAVPAAFSPSCSDVHLPGYLARADELRAAGAETIACLSVNDGWTMGAWGKVAGVRNEILMLGDQNRDFTSGMDLEIDLTDFGDGIRSRRYAAVVDDGVVRWLAVEPGPGVHVSGADAALAALRSLA